MSAQVFENIAGDWKSPGRAAIHAGAVKMLVGACPDTTTEVGYEALEATVGQMGIRRCYNFGGTIPSSIAASAAAPDVGHRTSWLSISNVNPSVVTDGSHDAAITSFATSVGSHPMMLTFNHEPENDGFSAASQMTAARHFYDLVRAANPAIRIGPVLMDWTFDPASGLTASDWDPGAGYRDFFGIDTYQVYKLFPLNTQTTWWDVPYTRMLNYFTYLSTIGNPPPAVGEFGCRNFTGDSPTGTRKAGWISNMVNYFESRNAVAMCYFNTNVNGDYAADAFLQADAPTTAFWQALTASHTGWPT